MSESRLSLLTSGLLSYVSSKPCFLVLYLNILDQSRTQNTPPYHPFIQSNKIYFNDCSLQHLPKGQLPSSDHMTSSSHYVIQIKQLRSHKINFLLPLI